MLANGRSLFVLETPAKVLAKIEKWDARSEKRMLTDDGGPM